MHLLFGEAARAWKIVLFEDYREVLVAVLPPGAFLFSGLLIALHRMLDDAAKARRQARAAAVIAGGKRVRVTGNIR